MVTVLMVLGIFVEKYIIYPSQGRKFPKTIKEWFVEDFKETNKCMKEMRENIKDTFSFKK